MVLLFHARSWQSCTSLPQCLVPSFRPASDDVAADAPWKAGAGVPDDDEHDDVDYSTIGPPFRG